MAERVDWPPARQAWRRFWAAQGAWLPSARRWFRPTGAGTARACSPRLPGVVSAVGAMKRCGLQFGRGARPSMLPGRGSPGNCAAGNARARPGPTGWSDRGDRGSLQSPSRLGRLLALASGPGRPSRARRCALGHSTTRRWCRCPEAWFTAPRGGVDRSQQNRLGADRERLRRPPAHLRPALDAQRWIAPGAGILVGATAL